MSTVTPNLGLIKPADSEYIDVADLNANFDTLDAAWLAQDIIRVTDSDPLDPVTAVSTGQIQFKDNSVWKGLDEVRLYNNSDALYCKDGVTTGLLMQNNQIKIVSVTWNNGVPAVGTTKGYIDANGDYHSANTSLETLRESVTGMDTLNGAKISGNGTPANIIFGVGAYPLANDSSGFGNHKVGLIIRKNGLGLTDASDNYKEIGTIYRNGAPIVSNLDDHVEGKFAILPTTTGKPSSITAGQGLGETICSAEIPAIREQIIYQGNTIGHRRRDGAGWQAGNKFSSVN